MITLNPYFIRDVSLLTLRCGDGCFNMGNLRRLYDELPLRPKVW